MKKNEIAKLNQNIAFNKRNKLFEYAVTLQIAILKNHKTISSKIINFYAC